MPVREQGVDESRPAETAYVPPVLSSEDLARIGAAAAEAHVCGSKEEEMLGDRTATTNAFEDISVGHFCGEALQSPILRVSGWSMITSMAAR